MREIKLRNYIILAVLFVASIAIVLFSIYLYKESRKERSTNERLSILYEIKEDDLKNYFVENDDIVIYISSASSLNYVNFEDNLNKFIGDKEIAREIIYLNLDKTSSTFYTTLKEKYFKGNIDIAIGQPNMLLVEDGKVTKVLYESQKEVTLSDVESFLKENNVIEG